MPQIGQEIAWLLHLRSDEGNQGSANSATVLSDSNANLVGAFRANAVNSTQGLVDHVPEERIVFDQAAINTNVNDLLWIVQLS